MSNRHLFQSPDGLVNKCIRGLVSYNPSLGFDETNRVVFNTQYDKSKVAIISGGGSGHEPAWSGYVGENLLAASVAGDIFASPSTKQILAGIEHAKSDAGTILVVPNYTGDCLHFGLAAEKANLLGHKCRFILCGDDVSVGRKGSLVGRRGLAGSFGVLKVMGAASAAGGSLDQLYDLGVAFSQQMVSICATLDHCHVPGRATHAQLDPNEVEVGTGPHNEPGYQKLNPPPTPEELVNQLLTYCLAQDDPNRSYVKFNPGDETVLMVSNFGGISWLEMGALLDELLVQLDTKWNIQPVRVLHGFIETSLNAPAFSITVANITQATSSCSYSAEDIKGFFDAKTNTQWESMTGQQNVRRPRAEQFVSPPKTVHKTIEDDKDLKVDPAVLDKMIRTACNDLVAAEPDLTRWDTIMGDGDCGETLKTGGTELLAALGAGVAAKGSVMSVLQELEDIVEGKMGGTLGGILGIFFVALRHALENNISMAKTDGVSKLWGFALKEALAHLRRYTPAKVGDRTVMDTLIPFAEKIAAGDFDAGVKAAEEGAEGTKDLKAKLGRATYVGSGSSDQTPDPGAWGAMVVIKGLRNGMQ